MDTACLRIKFTPLMKNIHGDDSKCCLEIVPEVSCLKNLDKIKWKQDDHFFEYVIPMTYKIILKKKDCQKDITGKIDKQNPIYHSCVDLLHQSTTTDLSSGDVNRIVSDNIILSKVTSDIEKCSIIVTQSNDTSNMKNVNDTVTISVQTVEDSDEFTVADHKKTGSIKTNVLTQTLVFKNMDYPENFFHKIIETVMRVVETPATSHKATSPLRVINSNLRNLSVAPIFSFNTSDGALKKPLLENPNSRNHITPDNLFDEDIRSYFNSPIEERVLHVFTPKIKLDNLMPQYMPIKRPTPQERVGNFLQLMNREILPLRYVLEDILQKFSALNIPLDFYDHADQDKKQVDEIKNNEISNIIKRPQNRVVYTIVFDG